MYCYSEKKYADGELDEHHVHHVKNGNECLVLERTLMVKSNKGAGMCRKYLGSLYPFPLWDIDIVMAKSIMYTYKHKRACY